MTCTRDAYSCKKRLGLFIFPHIFEIQICTEPSNHDIDSQASPYIPPALDFSTGIKCKDKSSDPRIEMRGTNYWALYNYIPAEEVDI